MIFVLMRQSMDQRFGKTVAPMREHISVGNYIAFKTEG